MGHNKDCVELVLKIILEDEDLTVEKFRTQYTISNILKHGVRLDVIAFSRSKVYNIEVQRVDSGAIAKRARYHSAMIDVDNLRAGLQYSEMLETYVIFITENDVLKRNKPIYHIERKIEETGENFDDGTHIIYVNGADRSDTALGRLMQDFFARDASSINYKLLADGVKLFKETEEGVKIMSPIVKEIFEKGREEGREEGHQKGREEGLQEGREEGLQTAVLSLLKEKLPIDLIARAVGMPVEKIVEIGKANALI